MSDVITWILETTLQDGQRPALQALMREMTEATRANEPGCLLYDWFVTPEGDACHILESYADEAALMQHVATFNTRYARRLFAIARPRKMTVFGAPSETVRAALAPLKPVYLTRL